MPTRLTRCPLVSGAHRHPHRRQGTIGAQRFDTALLAAFPTLGLSEAQLASLRQPFSTADGLVKWRPFADTFVEVTRP